MPPVQKEHADDHPQGQGTEGEVVAPQTRQEDQPDQDSEDGRRHTAQDQKQRVEPVAGLGDVVDPEQRHGEGANAEKGVLTQTDLPRVPGYQVPPLSDDAVYEHREEEDAELPVLDVVEEGQCREDRDHNDREAGPDQRATAHPTG